MMRSATLIIMTLTFSGPALADQCAWNPKPIAEQAAERLAKVPLIQQYCSSCGDKVAASTPFHTAVIAPTSDPTLFEVQVDGQGIDLAYVFVPGGPDAKQWLNLGLMVGCAEAKDIDTPELSPDLVPKP